MRKTAPRINDRAAEEIATYFPSLNFGLEFILNSWPVLFRTTLLSLRGRFSHEELNRIVDLFKTVQVHPDLAGDFLSSILRGQIDKQGMDAGILGKITYMTRWEHHVIEIWASTWHLNDKPENDRADYIADLAGETINL